MKSLLRMICCCCVIFSSSCHKPLTDIPAPVTVKFAVPMQLSAILLHLAINEGFLDNHGITAEVSYYPSGKRALQEGLINGDAQVVSTADIPFILAIHEHHSITCLATLSFNDNVNGIIANRQKGINNISDLKGKRIGTQENSTVHHFHDSILPLYGIKLTDINTLFFKAETLPARLYRGEIDAFTMREPFLNQAKSLLGNDAISFKFPNDYIQYEVLLAKNQLLHDSPETVSNILKALADAEQYVRMHPQKALASFAKNIDMPEHAFAHDWQSYNAQLQFPQAALTLWEGQWQWEETLEEKNHVHTEPHEFMVLDYINEHFLKDLYPNKVSVIAHE
ncbi:ABC transporter substrate-binding protein [Shewanella intestini]|uniref:ABC transporter substrate-binding protein n=1 Tax=Shewanella intestini TaxID=2017544 RepID=A0ABS5I0W3_9GAMM|nr:MULTISPECIES: ABC transporter substrate-binding protein [Shewanella]MBR9726965.1 ABC transporter substrate-binding protein [Shewanella intestini]